jgi:hypothetical protein
MKNLITWSAAFGLLFTSCSGNEPVTEENNTIQECYYTINENTIQVNWVAYKFTDKTPVEGGFNEVNITGMKTLNSLESLISGLSFDIPVNTINSNNPERDGKILNTFFGNLNDTDVIKGSVAAYSGSELTLALSLNGMTHKVTGTSTFENGIFSFKANLDMKIFGASAAVDALNKLCYDLHIGPDGVSKLWEEVEIRFQCSVNEDC